MLEALDLSGKVAIVTGGGSGLGKEAAKILAKSGADLAVAGRRSAPIEETAAEIEALGRKALTIPTDVTDSSQVNRLVDRVVEEFGQIDILVNNAGISGADDYSKAVWEISDDDWRRGIDGDLTGTFYCSRAAGRHMVERSYGKIVNVSSGFGFGAMRGLIMYSVAKAGVIHLTRVLAMQWARNNINVNCIVPGLFAAKPEEMAKTREERAHKFIPVGYVASAIDLADLVLFLCTDASSYITGQNIMVDGGALVGAYAPWGYQPSIPLSEA
ncbi:MAG: SDR family NAD(P)-dependent oxidoreductase [Dehalococcoidia bacterium]